MTEQKKSGIVVKVLKSTFRPAFPFAPPGSTPFSDASQLSKFNSETKKIRKDQLDEQVKVLEEMETSIQMASLNEHDVFNVWCETLGVDLASLDRTVLKRYVLFVFLFASSILLLGYSIGVIRGLYEGISFSMIPPKFFGIVFMFVSMSFMANAIKIYFHIWCIRNRQLPNMFQWIKSGGFLK